MVPPEPPTLLPGTLVGGRYRLAARLARGGMAEVWEADDLVLSRRVAVKALLPHLAADEAFVTRFRREAVAAARLAHPNIVAIYDTCSERGCEAIVMELVRGRTLRDTLDDRQRLLPVDAVDIAVQVASALDHAHRHGLVHRDVKPANILLGDDGRVLVADFGIAKALDQGSDLSVELDLTEAGDVMGTAKYLSPEQVQGQVIDARTDVYALGVVLYEMLCGRPPFVGPTATATAAARLVDPPLRPRQVRAGIPRSLEEVTLRALARDPAARYPSAGALKAALGAADMSGVERRPDRTTTFDTDDLLTDEDDFEGLERRWVAPTALLFVVAATLAVVSVLLWRTDAGKGLFESVGLGTDGSGAVAVERAVSFDPIGSDRTENEDETALAHDGDPKTGWRTEVYFRNPVFGGLKEGVGLVVYLADGPALDALVLTTPTRGWSGRVYVGDGAALDLAGWGTPLATIDRDDTTDGTPVEVALSGARSSAVLLWITHLGVEHKTGGYQFELREVAFSG